MKTYEEIAKYHRQALDNLERLNCDGTLDNSKNIKESIIYHQLVAAACEKQIHKKPHIPNAGLEIDFAQCDCGGFLVSYFGGMYKYCKDCGQAVDWSKDHD